MLQQVIESQIDVQFRHLMRESWWSLCRRREVRFFESSSNETWPQRERAKQKIFIFECIDCRIVCKVNAGEKKEEDEEIYVDTITRELYMNT